MLILKKPGGEAIDPLSYSPPTSLGEFAPGLVLSVLLQQAEVDKLNLHSAAGRLSEVIRAILSQCLWRQPYFGTAGLLLFVLISHDNKQASIKPAFLG